MLELGNIDRTVLIFGGPYSNLAATAAMQQRARDIGIPAERIFCTGDLVAYCAEPVETAEMIRDWGVHVIMGNCEESLAFDEADCGCGFEAGSSCSNLAVTWYRYAQLRVGREIRRWMQSLPRAAAFELSGRRCVVVHGSPASINEFVFASSDTGAKLAQIRQLGAEVMIGGHSGIPFGQRVDDRFWLNAGVIGMPANDGGCHGWYMLIDPRGGELEISWHRLEYDYAASRRSTIAAGMPEYGEALASGLWPSMDILPAAERARQGQPLNLSPILIPARDTFAAQRR